MVRPSAAALLLFLLTVPLLPSACSRPGRRDAPAPAEWQRDAPNPFEDSDLIAEGDDYSYLVTRVVDDATGGPVEGARLFAQHEHDHALPRLARPGRIAGADDTGWIRYALEPYEGNWYYVDAPGYGPFAMNGGLPAEVRLRRGVDLTVTLRDTFGKPVKGAYVGYYLGCGHTPDSRQARTDGNGRAVIPCVNPEDGILFPVGAGIEARDYYVPDLAPDADGSVEIVAWPGRAVDGQVLDEQGRPLAGAQVHGSGWNHGPRAKTDADGRFRVEGVEAPFAWLEVVRDGRGVASFDAPPPGVRTVLRLPSETAQPTFDVTVEVTDAEEGEVVDRNVTVCAVRAADGHTQRKRTNAIGQAYLSLPRGRYALTVGEELGHYRPERREIDVERDLEEPLRFELRPCPRLRVDAAAVPPDWTIALASARSWTDVTDKARDGVVPAPAGVDLVLRLQWGDVCGGIVPVPREGRGDARPPLVLPAPTEPPPEPQGILPEPRPVKVLLPDGSPAVDVPVHAQGRNSFHAGTTDDDGVAVVGFRGAHVRVQPGDDMAVLTARLEGDGPWTLRLGPCAIELDVRDARGEPVPGYLFALDGALYGAEDAVRIRGLQPGAHRILVAAEGYLAKDCRVVLADGETRALPVKLRRPPR